MYTPNSFRFHDGAEKVAFIKEYSFATIVTNKENYPIATQLPFHIDGEPDKLILRSHFAIANEQAKHIEKNVSLIIFSQPHAYISPAHYDAVESVPTWNYMAVHAYGTAKIIRDQEDKANLLEATILYYEKQYLEQWNKLSDKFRKGLLAGIVGFELEVTRLEGIKKLSQNKSLAEKQRIIDHLSNSGDSLDQEIARRMGNG